MRASARFCPSSRVLAACPFPGSLLALRCPSKHCFCQRPQNVCKDADASDYTHTEPTREPLATRVANNAGGPNKRGSMVREASRSSVGKGSALLRESTARRGAACWPAAPHYAPMPYRPDKASWINSACSLRLMRSHVAAGISIALWARSPALRHASSIASPSVG
jgi:hypothetical protein